MFTVKAAAVVGIAALAVSFFVSLATGAGFLRALLRSGLSGSAFFAITAGTEMLLKQFLPELFEPADVISSHKRDTEEADGENSNQIDILLGDDGDNPSSSSSSDTADHTVFYSGEPRVQNNAPADDFIEEVSAVDDADDLEEAGSDEPFRDDDGVEELPSMDNFSDTFETFVSDGPDDDGPVSGARDLDVDIMGDQQNVEDVVRAVRTVLKKDQEG
ncbi:MAG: hypothetical protein JXB03_05020 [Spirochaetales bacterium]|nr:hypothetical protein [Spirochaetales bacterium]